MVMKQKILNQNDIRRKHSEKDKQKRQVVNYMQFFLNSLKMKKL